MTCRILSPLLALLGILGPPLFAQVLIPELPEPLKTRYESGTAPSVKSSLEARMAAARASALWISPTAAAGAAGSEADPMNLAEGSAHALANRGISILFHPGNYDARGIDTLIDYSGGINSSTECVIGAPDGAAVFNAGHEVPLAAMTDLSNGSYSFSFDSSLSNTPANARLVMVMKDGDGRSYFDDVSSAAEVAGTPGSYHFDVASGTVTLRFEHNAGDVVIFCSQHFLLLNSVAAEVGLYGITLNHFRGGGPNAAGTHLEAYDVHVNFAWDFGNRTDGWSFGANTQATLENCSGNNVQNDGFNSKGDNVYLRLVNCEAIGNNDDGFSPHRDSERWEVWGGLYQNNGKGNITPAGGRGFIIGATLDSVLGRMDGYSQIGSFRALSLNADTTQVTWIKDSIIRNSGSGSRAVFNEDSLSYVRLENTRIEDADTGLYSRDGGRILALNPRFENLETEYSPSNDNIDVQHTLWTYPAAPGETLNNTFTVKANGIEVPVVDEVRTYAHFSFSGEVEIEVTGLNNHSLSPVDYGIVPSVNDGSRMVFTLDRPRYLVLHRGGEDELILFADPQEVDPPQANDLNVLNVATWNGSLQEAMDRVGSDPLLDIVYVPAGTLNLNKNLRLPSHSALYLAGGAKLNFTNGGIQVVNAEKVKLFGRGLIEYNENGGNDREFGIWTHEARNLEISGIISRNSLNWNVLLEDSEEVDITYFKVLNDKTGVGE